MNGIIGFSEVVFVEAFEKNSVETTNIKISQSFNTEKQILKKGYGWDTKFTNRYYWLIEKSNFISTYQNKIFIGNQINQQNFLKYIDRIEIETLDCPELPYYLFVMRYILDIQGKSCSTDIRDFLISLIHPLRLLIDDLKGLSGAIGTHIIPVTPCIVNIGIKLDKIEVDKQLEKLKKDIPSRLQDIRCKEIRSSEPISLSHFDNYGMRTYYYDDNKDNYNIIGNLQSVTTHDNIRNIYILNIGSNIGGNDVLDRRGALLPYPLDNIEYGLLSDILITPITIDAWFNEVRNQIEKNQIALVTLSKSVLKGSKKIIPREDLEALTEIGLSTSSLLIDLGQIESSFGGTLNEWSSTNFNGYHEHRLTYDGPKNKYGWGDKHEIGYLTDFSIQLKTQLDTFKLNVQSQQEKIETLTKYTDRVESRNNIDVMRRNSKNIEALTIITILVSIFILFLEIIKTFPENYYKIFLYSFIMIFILTMMYVYINFFQDNSKEWITIILLVNIYGITTAVSLFIIAFLLIGISMSSIIIISGIHSTITYWLGWNRLQRIGLPPTLII
ncbi:hypothetical protein [Macellibacteroides fermentans]|uniref:hypothetical protein n=1 Tax=Macellibacteroides fermentans TaxID=879969 RepID=UPI00406D10AF